MNRERGNASLNIFIVLIFLSVLGLGLTRLINQSQRMESRIRKNLALQNELEEECRGILDQLCEDGDPEVNNRYDNVFEYIRTRESTALKLSLRDISSLINREYADENVFPLSDFDEDLFTIYSWNNEELNSNSLSYPYSNGMPLFNIYFTDEEILGHILSQSYEGETYDDWNDMREKIIVSRDDGSLTIESLVDILETDDGDGGEDRTAFFLNYLGVTTWFWEIRAEKAGHIHRIIAARLPLENDREKTLSSAPRYQVVKSYRDF